MMVLYLARAEDITLERLEDGPGLLPFKLGAAKIVSHYHSFLLYIDLDDIQSKVNEVALQLSEFKPLINNSTLSLFDPHISYLTDKLNQLSSQLESFKPSRSKRGLIDGLGSVIKSISGNLDYTDAVKYNNAIQVLQGNEDKLMSEFNSHISLTKDWMFKHSSILEKLLGNQNLIAKKLNSIIKQDVSKQDLVSFAHLAQHLLILNDNIESLSDELNKIEYMLAFVHASSATHSMVSLVNLKSMLGKLRLLYSKDEIIEIDPREYYNIIRLGSYYIDKRIVIVIKLPIASPGTYTLYKLSIVPNKNNLALIPTLPYIAIRGSYSMYIETECPKLNSWYLCEEKIGYKILDKPDCVQQLITQQHLNSCTLTPVALHKEALEQLDDRHYTLSFPHPTKVQSSCGQEKFQMLQGSYLATIPQDCILRTTEFTIANLNDRIEGHVLEILSPSIHNASLKTEESLIQLNSINLESLHDSYKKVSVQPSIKLEPITDSSIYHTTIPVYLLLLGAGALSIALTYRRYFVRNKGQKGNSTEMEAAQDLHAQVELGRNIRPAEIRVDPNNLTATFSTPVNK